MIGQQDGGKSHHLVTKRLNGRGIRRQPDAAMGQKGGDR
jgi:hypothetical protein